MLIVLLTCDLNDKLYAVICWNVNKTLCWLYRCYYGMLHWITSIGQLKTGLRVDKIQTYLHLETHLKQTHYSNLTLKISDFDSQHIHNPIGICSEQYNDSKFLNITQPCNFYILWIDTCVEHFILSSRIVNEYGSTCNWRKLLMLPLKKWFWLKTLSLQHSIIYS